MPNMSLKKVPMPEQEPNVRNHNFQEVSLGYTKEMAMEEAARCLNCKHKPCVGGCPVNIRIPEFIAKVDVYKRQGSTCSGWGRTTSSPSPLTKMCIRDSVGDDQTRGKGEKSRVGDLLTQRQPEQAGLSRAVPPHQLSLIHISRCRAPGGRRGSR